MDPRDEDLMTAGEAQRYLGISKTRMAALLKAGSERGGLDTYGKEVNLRIKWVLRSEVESLKKRMHIAKKLARVA